MLSASGSSIQMRYIPEVTPGVTPTTGNAINLRATGSNLKYDVKSEVSKEMRADRMTAGSTLVSASVAGGIPFELSYKEYDTFLAAALQGAWGTPLAFSGSAYLTVTTDAVLTATTGTPFAAVEVGQFVKVGGFTTPKNAAFARVKAKTSASLTFDASEGFVAEGSAGSPVANVTVNSTRVKNGVLDKYFTIEEHYTDIGQFRTFRGMTPGKLSFNFSNGAILGGSLEFMGYGATITQATALPGTPVASQTFSVMNSVVGVGNVFEGGTPVTGTAFKNLKLEIDNTLRGKEGIGTLGFVGIGSGTLAVTGSVEAYFANATLYNKFLQNTSTSLAWSAKDTAGNGYGFSTPNVKFSGGDLTGQSLNSDVMVTLQFTAEVDVATGCMIAIDKAGA